MRCHRGKYVLQEACPDFEKHGIVVGFNVAREMGIRHLMSRVSFAQKSSRVRRVQCGWQIALAARLGAGSRAGTLWTQGCAVSIGTTGLVEVVWPAYTRRRS